MCMRRLFGLLLTAFSTVVLAHGTAFGAPPSPGCFDSAALCQRAYDALLQCQAQSAEPGTEDCAELRTKAEQACRNSSAVCDQDGSRHAPR